MVGFMKKAGWVMYAAVILCFFLPFFAIKCNDITLVEVSGMDMVAGCQPESEMGGGGGMDSDEAEMEEIEIEKQPFAIAALALTVIGLCLTFVRIKSAWIGSGLVALAALGMLFALYGKAKSDLPDDPKKDKEEAEKQTESSEDELDMNLDFLDKDVKITIEPAIGYFGAILCLILAAVGSFMTWRSPPDAPAGAGPPGAPPPGGFGTPGAPPGGPPVAGAPPGGGFGAPPGGSPA